MSELIIKHRSSLHESLQNEQILFALVNYAFLRLPRDLPSTRGSSRPKEGQRRGVALWDCDCRVAAGVTLDPRRPALTRPTRRGRLLKRCVG